MFSPGFPNACCKSSFDADCSGSYMPVVLFVQGEQKGSTKTWNPESGNGITETETASGKEGSKRLILK